MEQPSRLGVAKTHKMLVGGKFIRSESGRVTDAPGSSGAERVCVASRKDLRDAVGSARGALTGWSARDAYNRGQILYRVAEMFDARASELEASLAAAPGRVIDARAEVAAAIDACVHFAGWADKASQALGSLNQVSGPYFNVSTVEPVGVVGVVIDPAAPLASFASLVCGATCLGSAVVCVWPTDAGVLASSVAEAVATSDTPGGVVNILTAGVADLAEELASHRGVDALFGVCADDDVRRELELGAAENLKRVHVRPSVDWSADDQRTGLPWVSAMAEIKTCWHPAGV